MTGLKGACPNWTCRPSEFRARGPIGALAAFTKTVSTAVGLEPRSDSERMSVESGGDGGPTEGMGVGNCEVALTCGFQRLLPSPDSLGVGWVPTEVTRHDCGVTPPTMDR